jgi:hypothetical protein
MLVINLNVDLTKSKKATKMSNSKHYLFFSGILCISACGQGNELHDVTTDQSFDSQQTPDSQMVIEDVDSSILQEDSSLTEVDAFDASVVSDADLTDSWNDAGIDSARNDASRIDAAREPNVLYRTSDGGFEGIISISRNIDSTSYDGRINSDFISVVGVRYFNPYLGRILGRIFVAGCPANSWIYLYSSNILSGFPDSGFEETRNLTIYISGSCSALSPGTAIVRMETLVSYIPLDMMESFIYNRGVDDSHVLFLNKTVRVE